METTAAVRQDMDATRARMAETAGEIESRIHDKVDAVKQKLDVAGHVRSNPWPALAVAMIAGAAIAATDSDRKAAVATKRAVKKAPRVTVKAAKATASGTAHLATAAVSRLRGGDDEEGSDGDKGNGFMSRAKARFAEQARELGECIGRAADELVKSSAPPRNVS